MYNLNLDLLFATAWMKKASKTNPDFLIVQAAGNNGIDAIWTGLFAAVADTELRKRIIIVGSIDPPTNCPSCVYALSSDSNRGSRVDVVAPGTQIYSTLFSGYGAMSGTSMAAPHVTGVAGLIWSANSSLSAAQVKKIIVDSADRAFTGPDGRPYKVLNAKNAILEAGAGTLVISGINPSTVTKNQWVTFTLTGAGFQSSFTAVSINELGQVWPVSSTEYVSSTTARVTVFLGSGPTSTQKIRITNPDGQAAAINFTALSPGDVPDPPGPYAGPVIFIKKLWFTDNKTEFGPNEGFYAYAEVRNVGQEPKKDVKVTFYRSDGLKVDTDPKNVGTENIKHENLKQGMTKTEQTHVQAPNEPGKNFNIIACVSYDGNKTCSAPLVFRVKEKPDFKVVSLLLVDGTGKERTAFGPNEPVTVKVQATNLSDESGEDIQVQYTLANAATPAVTSLIGTDNIKHEHLLRNGTKWEDITFYAPAAIGSYVVTACLDPLDSIDEKNETNNCATIPFEVSLTPSINLILYDDFGAANIDTGKWQNAEYIREIKDGALHLKVRGNPWYTSSYIESATNLRQSASITSLAADVRLTEYQIQPGVRAMARVCGRFFNDGSSATTGFLGDIFAAVGIVGNTTTSPTGYWIVARQTSDSDSWSAQIIASGFFSTPVELNKPYRAEVVWDGSAFVFRFAGEELTYAPGLPVLPAHQPHKFLQAAIAPTNMDSYIAATFDNLAATGPGGTVITDDFSLPQLDSARWTWFEYVRQVETGKLRMKVRTSDGYTSSVEDLLTFTSPDTISAMETEVTILKYDNGESAPTARAGLYGRFFNDGTAGTGYLGDIAGIVGIGDQLPRQKGCGTSSAIPMRSAILTRKSLRPGSS